MNQGQNMPALRNEFFNNSATDETCCTSDQDRSVFHPRMSP